MTAMLASRPLKIVARVILWVMSVKSTCVRQTKRVTLVTQVLDGG